MENILLVIFLYFIATVLSDKQKRKKRVPPVPKPAPRRKNGADAPQRKRIEFEIPPLEGAPPLPGHPSAESVPHEAGTELPERQADPAGWNVWQEYAVQKPQANPGMHAAEEPPSPEISGGKGEPLPLSMNPRTALQAVAMAEVLNRPRAYQMMRRYHR